MITNQIKMLDMLKGLTEEQLISYVQEPRSMDRPMDRMGGYGDLVVNRLCAVFFLRLKQKN